MSHSFNQFIEKQKASYAKYFDFEIESEQVGQLERLLLSARKITIKECLMVLNKHSPTCSGGECYAIEESKSILSNLLTGKQ